MFWYIIFGFLCSPGQSIVFNFCWTVLILLMGVYVCVYIQSLFIVIINLCIYIGLLQFCGVFLFFPFFLPSVFLNLFSFFIILIFLTYNIFIHLFLHLPFLLFFSPCCCCCCWGYVASVISDSVRPHRWQPARLLCPRDSQAGTLEWVAISSSFPLAANL